ncbi:hypothetical protein DBZ36_07330 [Alginatibacterium sediminis]|uniref:Glycine-zipper-containing OmpA-like membrane domain-containing protein n=2 Tax=Alginatibacterium sediminis TaxID=2164068 RepID=A0A420EIU6_9ALTE|nr:hypothetical protein DBZ36_07330 [Alginatibacterium sediminis]
MTKAKLVVLSSFISVALTACENTAKGAGQGALAGAAGGLVSSLIWGGDALEGAARGAAVGAASGAVIGAMQDSNTSSTPSSTSAPEQEQSSQMPERTLSEEQLIANIGKPAVDGIVALAQCDYNGALNNAQLARDSANSEHQEAGIWVQALTFAETGDVDKLNASYADIIKLDKQVSNILEVQSELSKGLDKLKGVRAEHDLPTSCS